MPVPSENLTVVTKNVDNSVKIICVGDLHIGSRYSNYLSVEKLLDAELKKDSNSYVMWLGDLADYAVMGSKGDVYSASMTPEQQKREVKRILERYKERTLIVVEGNHEYRIRRAAGISDIADWCAENNIAYTRDLGLVVLYVSSKHYGHGRALFKLAVGHGYTSARTIGGKITANGRLTEIIEDADIYITGHTHQPSITCHQRYAYDHQNRRLTPHTYYLLTIPSYVDYEEYAAKKFMQPTGNCMLHIFLNVVQRKKRISVSMTPLSLQRKEMMYNANRRKSG